MAADGRHHGEGEHDERDMAMPAMPGAAFIVVEPEFIFGGLKAILDGLAVAFNGNQRFDGGSRRAPSGEEGEIAAGDVTTDQQAIWPASLGLVAKPISPGTWAAFSRARSSVQLFGR